MKKDTIIRTVILAVALLNQVLTSCCKNPLPFSDEGIYQAVTLIATSASSLWAWWKNNSFTVPAREADEYMNEIKEGNDA